jgi:GNAT superfamily N-acetyltransferase
VARCRAAAAQGRALRAQGRAIEVGSLEAAAEATACYGGELLPDDPYEEWAEGERERLRARYESLLRQAERWTELLELDPTDESARLTLMRQHARADDRHAALRQYERLERAVRQELGVAPGRTATALRDEMLGLAAPSPTWDDGGKDLVGRRAVASSSVGRAGASSESASSAASRAASGPRAQNATSTARPARRHARRRRRCRGGRQAARRATTPAFPARPLRNPGSLRAAARSAVDRRRAGCRSSRASTSALSMARRSLPDQVPRTAAEPRDEVKGLDMRVPLAEGSWTGRPCAPRLPRLFRGAARSRRRAGSTAADPHRTVPLDIEATDAGGNMRNDTSACLELPGDGLLRPQVRPLLGSEQGPVQAVFNGMSSQSRRMRFLTGVPRLTGQMLRLLTAIDHERHGAWVTEVDGDPVAIARWVRLDEPDVAEIALSVVDAYQGRGLGRSLLQLLGVAASEAGITAFAWSADAENRRVLRLLSDLPGTRRTSDGVVEARTALPPGDGIDSSAVHRLVASARWSCRKELEKAA